MTNRIIVKAAMIAALQELDRLNPERYERRLKRGRAKEYWERMRLARESQRINNLIIERDEKDKFLELRKKWFAPCGRELSGEAEWQRCYGGG